MKVFNQVSFSLSLFSSSGFRPESGKRQVCTASFSGGLFFNLCMHFEWIIEVRFGNNDGIAPLFSHIVPIFCIVTYAVYHRKMSERECHRNWHNRLALALERISMRHGRIYIILMLGQEKVQINQKNTYALMFSLDAVGLTEPQVDCITVCESVCVHVCDNALTQLEREGINYQWPLHASTCTNILLHRA